MKEEIEIQLSKNKIILAIIGALLFVVAGVFLIVFADLYKTFPIEFLRKPMVIQGIGVVCILFFGSIGVYTLRKLSDKKAGLIVDSIGITDNSNAASIGLIEWSDITDVEIKQVVSTKFLLIHVLNPEKYIAKAESKIKAKLMKSNMTLCGTPIAITSNTLKCNLVELDEILQTEFNRNKIIR